MAGRGSRFTAAGFDTPKPFIEIHGQPMIAVVVRNITPSAAHRFIFICLDEHIARFRLDERLGTLSPGCVVVPVERTTEGAACTVLLARGDIDGDDPLMIANSDQWVDMRMDDYLGAMEARGLDGIIMTMRADDPKWSFVRIDGSGLVTEVVEKRVISNDATVGIYNFRAGRDFVAAADRMIAKGIRVNGEFYVAPVYNELIVEGRRIGTYSVGTLWHGMYGLGTPEDLRRFLSMPVSRRAAAGGSEVSA